MTTATYPGGAGTITLDPAEDLDLSVTPIVLSYVGPSFSVSSSVAAGKLSITFHTDMPLNALPTAALVSGAGSLGSLKQVNTTTYTCTYSPAAGDSVAQIRIAENAANPVVPGSPASKTFGFDVAPTLVEQEGTTFYNAQGASADMMGAQDNSTVYVPPFALAGGDATSAITLTATRYGDPGAQLGDEKAVTGVYEFDFTKDGQPADVHLAHEATVTLSFKLPVGMTPAEFEATLKVGFKNESLNPPQWVWNDLANSNPASGISDIRINWASNSITFKASHFTAFAAATDAETLDVTTTGLSVTYTDADGTKVKVALRAGQGLLHFTGIGMSQATTKAGITVSGSSLKLDTVTLSGTTAAGSSLTFTTTGGRFVGAVVGAITGTPLSSLAAHTITLDGAGISIPTGAITTVKLANIDNGADITMGAPAKPVAITCGAIGVDSSIALTGAIKSLTASRWASGALTASSLASLKVAGGFGANVTLSGAGSPTQTLGKAKIGGSVNTGSPIVWDVTGKVGSITIAGGLTNSMIELTNPLATDNSTALAVVSFYVGGRMDDSTLVSAGNVGTVSVGAMRDSNVYAGLPDTTTGLPTDGAFDALAAARRPSIKVATVRGIKGLPADDAFENSNIAAWKIGKATLTNVVKDTPGGATPFGVAANALASYTRKQGVKPAYSWVAKPTTLWPADDGSDFSVARVL